jgi:hypothetical protein
MATTYETQRAAEQKAAAEQAKKSATVEAIISTTGPLVGFRSPTSGFFYQAIQVLGGAAIAFSQYFDAKAAAKKKDKLTQHQQLILTSVDKILSKLESTGNDFIDKGQNPLTPEFEYALFNALFTEIGYRGNCNLTARMPGDSKTIWFEMVKNGTVLVPTRGLIDPPPNFSTYWSNNCRNIRDAWLRNYQNKLILEGRQIELKDIQVSQNKQKLFFRVIFGLVFCILLFLFARNFMRIR